MQPDYPPFAEAKSRLEEFLRSLGHSGKVAWVFPGDVLFSEGRMLVRRTEQQAAQKRAEAEYSLAAQRRLGVGLDVLGAADQLIFTHVISPSDQDQAARFLMPDGLKLSVSKPLREVVLIPAGLPWWWRSIANRGSRSHADQIFGLENGSC